MEEEKEEILEGNTSYPWDFDADIYTDIDGERYSLDNLSSGIIRFSMFNQFTGVGSTYDNNTYGVVGESNRALVINKLGFSAAPTKAECDAAMTTIKVDTLKHGKMNIQIHKSLSSTIDQIFREIKDAGFDVYQVGGYCYRQINNPSNKSKNRPLSMHSFGCAIDINWSENPFIKGGKPLTEGDTTTKMRTYNSPVVRIMAKYGFGWGGRYGDYMHFSMANGK